MPKKKEETKKPKKETKEKSKKKVITKKIPTSKSKTTNPIELGQPEINIGLVGHVDHGKTTLTEQLSGKWTDTHSEELKRGITIRLGYADTIIRKCPECDDPDCWTTLKICPAHLKPTEPVRKISIVDAPGHESLMATMLAGTTIMDGALLLIAANEKCPQPQTKEHLTALEIAGIKNIIIIQNKIDVISKDDAIENYNQIKEFIKGTPYGGAPIIPISAKRGVNIDLLLKTIQEVFPTPKRNEKADPEMFIARSFDVNKPGIKSEKLTGGVLGGVVSQGKLKVGDKIEIRPGHVITKNNQIVAEPIFTTIKSMISGGNPVEEIKPGGSMAIMTDLDPSIVHSDSLSGNIVGLPDKLPPIRNNLKLKVTLLERVVGAEDELLVNPIAKNEILMLNVNSATTVGFVTDIYKDIVECRLKLPVCAQNSRVTISRRIGNRFRLIGYGIIQ
jgi:translation initiation factor 2 subunit 3